MPQGVLHDSLSGSMEAMNYNGTGAITVHMSECLMLLLR